MSKLDDICLLAQLFCTVYRAERADTNPKLSLCFSSHTDQKGEIVEETLCGLGFQVANEPAQLSTFHGYTGHEADIDVTGLKEMLRDKKISWRMTLEEINSDNIIELDTSAKRRQSKLKQLSYNL